MTANAERGEVDIRIGEQDFVLRPSFAALAKIEAECGPLMVLARRLSAAEFGVRDIVSIITHTIVDKSAANLAERIVAAGIVQFAVPCARLVAGALSGGVPPGNAEAPATTPA